ncbi:hypothetical protein CsSME_00030009 [Camellia sinensis var. sinensis]
MMLEALKEKYLLFQIFNEKHWTLLVLDTENGSWKFYNSIRPTIETDNHLNKANKVRKVIEKYLQHHNPKLIEGNKFHEETEIAMNCPQQVDLSLDYGVIVCYLIREYVYNKDIFPNLTNDQYQQIRADIIDALLTNKQTDTQQNIDDAIEAVLEDKDFWNTIYNDNNEVE